MMLKLVEGLMIYPIDVSIIFKVVFNPLFCETEEAIISDLKILFPKFIPDESFLIVA